MTPSPKNLFSQWGFTPDSWKGQRGEYWVLAQFALLLGFVLVPAWPQSWPQGWPAVPLAVEYGLRGLAAAIALGGLLLLGKGLIDLGQSLTPLPYPRADGELVQTGVYGLVRHSLYGGLIMATFGLSLWRFSLSHGAVALGLALVLNAKASQEEVWLLERYPAYADYRQRVKKLVPWVY